MYDVCVVFFFSSRRRHTRCALVTGVQTCALPIYEDAIDLARRYLSYLPSNWREAPPAAPPAEPSAERRVSEIVPTDPKPPFDVRELIKAVADRPDERRVGKAWVSTCRSRWVPSH